jgi:heavy metal translocating P-type ATPase
MEKVASVLNLFKIPILVLVGIISFIFLNNFFSQSQIGLFILFAVILIGSLELLKETAISLFHRTFALDYIALLAITTGLLTQQYIVAAVVVLMLSGGESLEKYGIAKAKQSLTGLADRIPHSVQVKTNNEETILTAIEDVVIGQKIIVRKGEVIPLDGVLLSETGTIDESSLTGEPYPFDKVNGDNLRSGTVNVGQSIIIEVKKADKDSTYRKIIQLVEKAQSDKSPLIRLADQYSVIFTITTFVIAASAFLLSHDFSRVLSVLVIATPCPLILATPIALMGGMNASAKKRILMKKLSSLEVLSRVQTIIFDKTGTLTLGKPRVSHIEIFDPNFSRKKVLEIVSGMERNSLHPFAKAILETAKTELVTAKKIDNVREEIGIGIFSRVDNEDLSLKKDPSPEGMGILFSKNDKTIARIDFDDDLKSDSVTVLKKLKSRGLKLLIFTGDKLERAKKVLAQIGDGANVEVKANCSPEDKRDGISHLKKAGQVVAMVGDGINDAPALALADVGIVFSNEEHTASSEAADVILLGGDFRLVLESLDISHQTIKIARQSIVVGIGLSVIGMLFASIGIIPPIIGAITQEAIDIAVILNALRASRIK